MTVQAELDHFFESGLRRAHQHGPEATALWQALRQSTVGGKRFRPSLLLAAHQAYGGHVDDVAHRVATAVELLHTAFLAHDDVIDGDLSRRGAPNVSGIFVQRAADAGAGSRSARTVGMAAGVLAGDLALVGAMKAFAVCGADAATTARLLGLVERGVEVTAIGELVDVVLGACRPSDLDLAAVITMEEQKTAVYSFQLPLQLGAVLAGAADDVVDRLGDVGRLAGIGFQLVDDLRGVFGDERQTGKSALGDLREGKMTPLMVHARSTSAWPEIECHLGDPLLDELRAQRLRLLLTECGSRAFVEELADSYVSAALRSAEELCADSGLTGELAALTRHIMASAA
ncbi:MAG TPA: polyprenyl synthetase family protein [Actinomycetales bacterium]|nr:polyprenyl synthetase family protein [Actinomycetales bacterium]